MSSGVNPELRGRRRLAKEMRCCARLSRPPRWVGLVCAIFLAFWPAGDASAVGANSESNAQAAPRAVSESQPQGPSQWNLQMERKWRAGQRAGPSSLYPSLDTPERAETLPSAAITPTPDETRDANDLVYGSLRTYVSTIERPPAALHVARGAKSGSARIDVAAGEAIPPGPDPNSDELTEEGKAESAIAVKCTEVASEAVLVAASIPAPTPDILVTRTVWHPHAVRRMVRVAVSGGAPVELKEGGRFGLLEVDRIDPLGVVFRYGGVEIFRRVGENRL